MRAYYNEIDPFKAEVLREAIRAGAIAPGDVDERSIADVQPGELVGYAQCHFFAGGGFWSLALRLAGWPDDRPVWTGSCPCPSFSAAGKGEGFADPRHLWPQWYRLIRERRPASVLGEQVAAAIGHGWLDLVCGDMEAEGYAIAAAVLGAHSAGAPHIRQRLYFGANSGGGNEWKTRESAGDAMCGPHGNTGVGARVNATARTAGKRIASSLRSTNTQHPKRRAEHQEHSEPYGRDGLGWSSATGQRAHADGRLPGDGDVQRGGQHGLFAPDRGTGEFADAELNGGRADFAQRGAQGRTADGRDSATGDGGDTAQRVQPVCGSASGSAGHAARAGEPERGGEPTSARLPFSDREGIQAAGQCDAEPECAGKPGIGHQPIGPRLEGHFGDVREWRGPGWLDPLTARSVAAAGATRGFWADCDWWYGRDGKYRPIGPGITPLIAGTAKSVLLPMVAGDPGNMGLACDHGAEEPQSGEARVGRLRGYGDAICVPVAVEFIQGFMEASGA